MNLREFFERYGVSLGVLAILALVVALVPGNAKNATAVGTTGGNGTSRSGVAGTNGAGGSDSSGGPGGPGGSTTGGGPGGVTGNGQAQAVAGSNVQFGTGPNCRPDGRQIGISLYMPPCADWKPGTDNGGATADGVTATQVKIIRWLGQLDDATKAILQANKLSDSDSVIENDFKALFSYSNHYYETYGREVVFEDFQASAPSSNQEAMIADAAKIADKHPFAVIEGNPAAAMPTVLARELGARGVMCLCTTSLTTSFYQDNPNVMSTGLPTGTDYCNFAAEYIGKRLAGKNAIYAGDELNPLQGFQKKPRVFGLLYVNGALGVHDPELEKIRTDCDSAFAQYGISFAAHVSYIYDPGKNQTEVSNMISQLKAAGVTTVVPIVDPLSPILITPEATRQNYFPEWFVTGTGLSDTTTAARLYDQNQWRHAFGMTPLWVTWIDRKVGAVYRAYHDAQRSAPDGSEGVLIEVYGARIGTLFRGIHMAGPNLNYDTFRQGMYAYPATPVGGGTASHPYVFVTPDAPTDIKDFAEVYYDITAQGNDERGNAGTGMMMKTDNGARYQLGQWPSDDPHVYQGTAKGAVAVSDNADAGDPPFTPRPEYGEHGCLSCAS